MRDLPKGWEWTTIGEVANIQLGRQRSPKNHTGPHIRPYLRSANVTWGGIDVSDVKEMNFEPSEAVTFELQPGDLLLNEASGSPNEVGKPAIWGGEIDGCCFQNTLLRVRSRGLATTGYLYWYCRSAALAGDFGNAGRGVNIRHLGKQGLAGFPLPLPPRAEQERVVAAIEEQLSRLDAAAALMRAAIARTEVLRKAAPQSVFPTADRLLSDVASIYAGTTPPGVGGLPPKGDVPFYKVGDMNSASGRWMAASRTYIENGSEAASRLRLWPAGTVIFPKQGGAIATNKKRQLREPAYCDLNTMGVVPGPELDAAYLYRVLEQVDLATLSDGTVIQQIKKPAVAGLRIGVPGLGVQRQIALQLDGWADEIDRIQEATGNAISKAASLRRSILTAAFRGELVRQDADDEPASALLARIQAGRAAATPVKRTRKSNAS